MAIPGLVTLSVIGFPNIQVQREIAPLVISLYNESKRAGIELLIYEGYRSPERQAELLAQGPDVTNAGPGKSFHQYALAIDSVPLKPNGDAWWEAPESLWNKLGLIGEKLGFEWGGRWGSPYDPGHFEYHPGLTIDDIYTHFKQTGGILVSKVLGAPWAMLAGVAILVFVFFARKELKL